MNEKAVLEAVEQALKQGADISIHFHDVPKEDAENLIVEYANKLERTYQHTEHEGTGWFSVVEHNNDQLDVAVFYDDEVKP